MEAEQLIQDKEWGALTEAERALVLPLAADEQEFNLLKKMLLVAREEIENVPPVNPAVHARLREAVAARQRKTFRLPVWSYAAAAALVVAVAGWLLLQKTGSKPDETKPPNYVRVDQKVPPPDTSIEVQKPSVVATIPQPSKEPRVHQQILKTVPPSHLSDDQTLIALASVNTSVGKNSKLMDVVAEAY